MPQGLAGALIMSGTCVLFGVILAVFRRRFVRASNGLYGGLGAKRLVWNEKAGERGIIVSSAVLFVIAAAVLFLEFSS